MAGQLLAWTTGSALHGVGSDLRGRQVWELLRGDAWGPPGWSSCGRLMGALGLRQVQLEVGFWKLPRSEW